MWSGSPRLRKWKGGKFGFQHVGQSLRAVQLSVGRASNNVKKLSHKPDEVKRVIKALIKANRYIRSNRDGLDSDTDGMGANFKRKCQPAFL